MYLKNFGSDDPDEPTIQTYSNKLKQKIVFKHILSLNNVIYTFNPTSFSGA